MKIRTKLALVIGLNLLLIIGVMTAVYINVKRIATAFEDVAGTTTPAIIHLHTMNEFFYSAAYHALAYPMTRDPEMLRMFNEGIEGLDYHKNLLIELVKHGNTVAPEDDQALMDRINKAQVKFVAAARQLSSHLDTEGALFLNHDPGKLDEDIRDIMAVGETIHAVAEPLKEWIEMEKEEVAEAQEAVEEAVEQTLFFVFGLSAVALFFIIIANGWVAFRISSPLRILETTAKAISSGDLSARAQVSSKDELGRLATAFNEMTGKLSQSQVILEEQVRSRTQELEVIKGSLEEKVKERTTELEALKSGLEKTVEERTQDLKKKMTELEQMNQMMTGRELKMVELKRELETLRQQVTTTGTARAGASVIVKPKRGKTNEEASREPAPEPLSSE